jgi:hypothetical protein
MRISSRSSGRFAALDSDRAHQASTVLVLARALVSDRRCAELRSRRNQQRAMQPDISGQLVQNEGRNVFSRLAAQTDAAIEPQLQRAGLVLEQFVDVAPSRGPVTWKKVTFLLRFEDDDLPQIIASTDSPLPIARPPLEHNADDVQRVDHAYGQSSSRIQAASTWPRSKRATA